MRERGNRAEVVQSNLPRVVLSVRLEQPLRIVAYAPARNSRMNSRMNGAESCHVRAVTRLPSTTTG